MRINICVQSKFNVILAKSAGYCFGVKRAVELAEQNAPAYTWGSLIHNERAVEALRGKGVLAAEAYDEIPLGSKVVIRSHGVSEAVYERLNRDYTVIDATCPFVNAIHKTVKQASESGIPVIVAGQREHPEVMGIVGWVHGGAIVVADETEAANVPCMDRALIVAQTTMGTERFMSICNALKSRIKDLTIKNTVCSATRERQAEAAEIARKCGVMLVVGDKNSANTRRLAEIAREYCPETHLISDAGALEKLPINPGITIGITAGASTPGCDIKEVYNQMSSVKQTKFNERYGANPECEFGKLFEDSMVRIKPGQTLTGKVLSIGSEGVFVGIKGYKSDGLIKAEDLSDTDIKVGDEIEAEVVKINDGEGNVALSQKGVITHKVWESIVAKYENGEYLDAVGKEVVKGGMLADVGGVRTFIPASQVADRFVKELDSFVGQPMQLKIIELDKDKKKIVASRRAVIEAEKEAKEKELWERVQEGVTVTGTVTGLKEYGAFVDIGGVDGLLLVKDMSLDRINDVASFVKVGDKINVQVTKIEYDEQRKKKRVSLSRKVLLTDPWITAEEKYPVGSIVQGKVVRVQSFGAFVKLEEGLDALVSISESALEKPAKIEDALKIGDVINAKVLKLDTENRKISLSVKQALEDAALSDESVSSTDDLDLEVDA